MKHLTHLNKAFLVPCTLAALVFMAAHANAQPAHGGKAEDRLLAQASNAPSLDKIRAQAQRMKEYREVLNDRDANVRLAALDELLKSNDGALREVAYDAAFASADQNMRAVALRSRILSVKSVVLELDNIEKLPEEQWNKFVVHVGGPKRVLNLDKPEPQTGNLMVNGSAGLVSGLEFSASTSHGAFRLRLGDGAVMTGTLTHSGVTLPARVALR